MDSNGTAELDAAQQTFEGLMEHLGLDPEADPQLQGTSERVTALWRELFSGLKADPPRMSLFEHEGESGKGEPLVLAGLPFYSMCAHHFLPFFGTIDIAYVPGSRVGGVGSFSRIVRHYALRPQIQERLVQQIADHLSEALDPQGVFVRIQARHLCMEMRGEKVQGCLVSTAATGAMKEAARRAEVLELISRATG